LDNYSAEDRTIALKVRETYLTINNLLFRLLIKVIEPSKFNNDEKLAYKELIESTMDLNTQALENIYQKHKDLAFPINYSVGEIGPSCFYKPDTVSEQRQIFEDFDAANQICEAMLIICNIVNNSIARVETTLSPLELAEYKAYRRKMGEILGVALTEVLPAIWRLHPELMPEEFKGS